MKRGGEGGSAPGLSRDHTPSPLIGSIHVGSRSKNAAPASETVRTEVYSSFRAPAPVCSGHRDRRSTDVISEMALVIFPNAEDNGFPQLQSCGSEYLSLSPILVALLHLCDLVLVPA